jgi:hypothetical protein
MKHQYYSYKETVDFLYAMEKENPELVKVEVIGKTHEDRDMVAVTITKDVTHADAKPALFYTGTIHAREWIGNELAIGFIKYLVDHQDYDPQVIDVLDKSTLYMVPIANPDGFEYSQKHFSFWRKNRRKNADGSYGVDLNRNFSVGFKANNNTSSNIYGGPKAFSEPETQALRDFVLDHPNISIALDYHSQGNVFFPAHNFRHEDEIDSTDINVLCANMTEEIRKISGREYGIHQGKPPAGLIQGSGREWYYSQGIIASVVEVGSRNISDYLENMMESVDENIPALMFALKEVPNYAKTNPLTRVEGFHASSVGAREVTLEWEHEGYNDSLYFEIYRSKRDKHFCQSATLVGVTKDLIFIDKHLESSTRYYYHIRAASKSMQLRSPFAPKLTVMTKVNDTEFSNIYYPLVDQVGYVSEVSNKNKEHFGVNSLFVGVNESKGRSYGMIAFSLKNLPRNAIIKRARLNLYPLNRVQVHVERYGEWRVGLVDQENLDSITQFEDVENATILNYIDRPLGSHRLTQGVWQTFGFSQGDCAALNEQIQYNKAVFRVEGPATLPVNRASQMMQFDIGYGKYGEGLEFRPSLEVLYEMPTTKLELTPTESITVSTSLVKYNALNVGFDSDGKKQYGVLAFDLTNMPNFEEVMIESAYFALNATQLSKNEEVRHHIEMVENCDDKTSYDAIRDRDKVERIGYEVSVGDLKKDKEQNFVFDRYTIDRLTTSLKEGNPIHFVITATTSKNMITNQVVSWMNHSKNIMPKLVINYMKKRRFPIEQASNAKLTTENGMIKLTWDNPADNDFKGVLVVKNRFRVPSSPYDGQKLYGGTDSYTYDNFGALDVDKYYAIFTYDNVPNFSEPTVIEYKK